MSECHTISCPNCGFSVAEAFVEQKCPRCQTLIESKFICGSCSTCGENLTSKHDNIKTEKGLFNKVFSKFFK